MRYCPNCGTRNKLSFFYCYKCGYKLKRDEIDEFQQKREEIPKEFKINEFITLKLEKDKIFIYIKGEKFLQCKYLLIDIPIEKVKKFDDIDSIDEAIERLDHSLEDPRLNSEIPIEIEFWGHASNLQAWAENDYDTRLLHHNLAFPLLKKLTDVGDKTARRVFKEEVAKRLMSGYRVVRDYLIEENYLDYFNDDEFDVLLEHFKKEVRAFYYEKYERKIESIELEALINIICSNLRFNTQFIIKEIPLIGDLEKIKNYDGSGLILEENHITYLTFNNCRLRILPQIVGNLNFLKGLFLKKNQIKVLPTNIGELNSLKILNLNDNQLHNLPNELTKLSHLNKLYLDHNNIKTLPSSIGDLALLKVLSLWGNQLATIPASIGNLKNLRFLGLSSNRLISIPDTISGLKSLQICDLSNNNLKFLPDTIGDLNHLQTLWLNNNPIRKLPGSLKKLASLKNLYLINTPFRFGMDLKTESLIEDLRKRDVNVWI
ncbi:MAG: leucine-rich repeat domain-containing protein [Promethearchaeota archaeon]